METHTIKDLNAELKPCPFCGLPGYLYDSYKDNTQILRVMCTRRDCAFLLNHFYSSEAAVRAWNTRLNEKVNDNHE